MVPEVFFPKPANFLVGCRNLESSNLRNTLFVEKFYITCRKIDKHSYGNLRTYICFVENKEYFLPLVHCISKCQLTTSEMPLGFQIQGGQAVMGWA